MNITGISFPYNTDVVTEKQFDEHIELYEGYVSKYNLITEKQRENTEEQKNANSIYSEYRCLKSGESYSLNGVILHELYFQNMGREGMLPGSKTSEIINYAFGSIDNFYNDLTACGKSARGWVVFAYDQRSKSYSNFMQDTHDKGGICLAFPLLVLDVYEHAYFLDYGADKAGYIKKFMKSINWDEVERRAQYLFS